MLAQAILQVQELSFPSFFQSLLISIPVMYIPAVPTTPLNLAYIERQKEAFIQGLTPPDFSPHDPETHYVGIGKPEDVTSVIGKIAMGLPVKVA